VKIQETNTLHKRQIGRSPKFLTEDRTGFNSAPFMSVMSAPYLGMIQARG
jgi:hypothetical protein